VYIIKAEEVQRLREPPRLATIAIRPEQVVLKLGEQASFTCSGIDQYGQPIATGPVEWSASGGAMDLSGLFTAGDHGGAFAIKATAGGYEGHAQVRLVTKDEEAPPPPPPGERYVRWRGLVPPQKWMNFYTRVLSKYATSPDLKLEVGFEVKVDREQADAKLGETKSGLRELGLNDDVALS
jgi:hypothetical protein